MKRSRPADPWFMLVAGLAGVLGSVVSGLTLVPRVRLVEVFTVVASSFAAGAALVIAVLNFRRSRIATQRSDGSEGRNP